MVEKKELNVVEHAPINWGWLKALPIWVSGLAYLAIVTRWFVLHLDESRINPTPEEAATMIATVVLVYALNITGIGAKLWKFICAYWRRNVCGQVANYSLNLDNKVQVWINRRLYKYPCWYGWRGGDLVWRVPLGGWFKRKPQLFVYREGCFGNSWDKSQWNFLPIYSSIYFLPESKNDRVHIQDPDGNLLLTTLVRAFVYARDDRDFTGILQEVRQLEEAMGKKDDMIIALGTLTESIILRLRKDFARFSNSQSGKPFLEELDASLSRLWPNYGNRRADQSRKQAVSQ